MAQLRGAEGFSGIAIAAEIPIDLTPLRVTKYNTTIDCPRDTRERPVALMDESRIRKWWRNTENLERLAYAATIISFPILVVSMGFIYWQLIDVRHIASSENEVALNSSFFSGSNSGIVGAIEDNKPILKEHGGQFSTRQLDNYLGTFETINDVYRDNLLTEDALCVSFSYYVTLAVKNKEVQKYLADNPDFFGGLAELKSVIEKSKNRNCR